MDLERNTINVNLNKGRFTRHCDTAYDWTTLTSFTFHETTGVKSRHREASGAARIPSAQFDAFANQKILDLRRWDRIYLDFFAEDESGVETKLGCCLLKKSTQRYFLRAFHDTYGPAELRCPPDAVNDLVDEEYRNTVTFSTTELMQVSPLTGTSSVTPLSRFDDY